jgi:predicted nucleotidyltransferase
MKYGLSNEIYLQIQNIIKKYNMYTFKLFGSRARGNFKINSDIDIAVIGNVSKEDEFKILNDFDLLEIPYTIDIVFVNKIQKQELLNSILKEGVDF